MDPRRGVRHHQGLLGRDDPPDSYDHDPGHRLSDGQDLKGLVDTGKLTGKLKGYEMDDIKDVEDGGVVQNMSGMDVLEDAKDKMADTQTSERNG
ncbi:hypothetical protein XPA_000703 [Xanthoria parietina]